MMKNYFKKQLEDNMAERRMFAKTIIDSDAFLDMPLSTQSLYFHLSMRADDDGFINNPKRIQRMIGCGDDDLKLLMAKKFILVFDSGVIVIKHWKIHNYIQKDRYKPTLYQEEKAEVVETDSKAYSMRTECLTPPENVDKSTDNPMYTEGIQDVYTSDTQVRLGKDRLGKDKKEKTRKYSDEHFRLASKLQNNLFEEFPKEMKKAKLDKWADEIRKMAELDKLTIEQIEYVIDWLPTNQFWFGNIRSTAKLREKFETLKHEIKKETAAKKAGAFYKRPTIREEKLPSWAEGEQKELEVSSERQAEIDARLAEYLSKK
jgi:hypothetical protein